MKMLKVLAIGVTVGGVALAIQTEKAEAAEWTPRSVEQIKAEISGNEYTIKWGDTLSAISGATNISVQKLAEWNSIGNVDVIFEGNKLVFEGNVASVQDQSGNTISQAIINENDKVNPGQPIGQAPVTDSSNDQGSPAMTVPAPPATEDSGSTDAGNTVTPPTGGDNGSTGGGNTVTPPAGGDNGSTEGGNTVTPPTGGDNGSTGDGNETTPPGEGDNGAGGDNGSEGNETDNIPVNIGNSGIFAATQEEANAQAYALWAEDKFVEFTRFLINPALNAKGDIIGWTVVFYN